MKFIKVLAIFVGMVFSTSSSASLIALVDFESFIQTGTVTNDAASTSSIVSIVYSLGTAGDGIATWDSATAGGVSSDFLSDPNYFQTVTFSGLNIIAGTSFNFGSLDIDLIQTLMPLSVTGSILDGVGTSLANAFVTITWADGSSGTTSFVQQAWRTTQNLTVVGAAAREVHAPASLALVILGVAGLAFSRKKA